MESINQIDLSSITNKDSDIYVIDATTLGGKSVSDFALLNGNNIFLGEENAFQGNLAAEEVEVFGEINARDFGAVWTLPGTAYIGEGIRFSTFDTGGGTISATVKGDPYDTTGVLQIEAPYAGIHLSDSEITLEVDRPAILNLKDGHAVMCADTKVEIYSNRDHARLEITPTEISIHNKVFDPEEPVRLSYIGGEDDELLINCESYFTKWPIHYGPNNTLLDHRYVRYGKLPWSEFITTYITDTNSCSYNKVEVEINTILGRKILDGVDSYWISLDEFRDSNLFFRAALLDPHWLELGFDGYTVSGLRLEFLGTYIRGYITHSDTSAESSTSDFTPDNTSDQYIFYRVYDWADYPLARDEEWSMSF